MRRVLALLICLSACLPVLAWAQDEPLDQGPVVKDIELRFEGPATVSKSVVLANVQTAVGKHIAQRVIEQDVRDLIATGYFFDVRVLQEPMEGGVKVIYLVRGKATLKEVIYEGHKAFKLVRLEKDGGIKVGDIYDERKAHDAALKLTDGYQKAGFVDAKVERDASVDKDTGKAILRFKITEGQRVWLKSVEFDGAKAFKVKVLRKLFKTRHRWWGSWMSGTGVIKDEQLREDLDALREYYIAHGYLDMAITGTRIDRVGEKWMVLHVQLFEGVQYKVGAVKIEGNKLFPLSDLEKRLKMTAGKAFTPEGQRTNEKALEDYYGTRGYLDSRVRATRNPSQQPGHIDLVYSILEGELTYIEKIQIRGNIKTKDKVIRRELAVLPGEIYDTVRVDRSADRLRNLGFFSQVETTPAATAVANRKDLVITVEEQRTGNVTFGAGFSSVDNLIGFAEVTQGNFDLFNWPAFTGGGQKLRLRMQLGLERQDYILSFTEPWFLDRRLALGFDLFHQSSSYQSDDFDEQRSGGAIRLEKALSEFMRGKVEYSVQDITMNVSSTASQELQTQDGSSLRSAMEFDLTYDTRDSVFLTTRGNRTEFTAEIAGGGLGGDVNLYKLNAKTSFYFPIVGAHVIQLTGSAGVVQVFGASKGDGPIVTETNVTPNVTVKVNDVPIYDRYFLGGPNNLRGFDYRDVSPKDYLGESIGGNTYMNATAEYDFPIVERIRGAVFFDIGDVGRDAYEMNFDNLKADVGIGVRLNLPIGPLRLDYGYPVMRDETVGKSGKIQFSVGYQF